MYNLIGLVDFIVQLLCLVDSNFQIKIFIKLSCFDRIFCLQSLTFIQPIVIVTKNILMIYEYIKFNKKLYELYTCLDEK